MIYHYTLPWPVLDSGTATLVKDRNDGVLIDIDGTQVEALTPLGAPTPIRTGPAGTTLVFHASIPAGRVRFGSVEAAVFADENMNALPAALAAQTAAVAAQTAAERAAANAVVVSHIRRTPDGEVFFTSTPVAAGGGQPIIRDDGTVVIRFS